MKKTSAFLSIIMVFFVLFGSLPFNVIVAYANTNKISSVALTGVGIPRPGMNPSLQALPVGVGYSVDTSFNDSSRKNGVTWVDDTENKIISSSNLSTYTFIEGHSYSVSIRVIANNGYEFAVDSGGKTTLTATVNSNSANTYNIYNVSSKLIVNVGYSFGVCKKGVVSQVGITGITEPKIGQKPSYTSTTNSAYYTVSTNRTNNYGVKNGIRWFDKTDNTNVNPDTGVFVADHIYSCEVFMNAKTGFEFNVDSSGYPNLSCSINSKTANVYKIYGESAKESVTVEYTFPELKNELVSSAAISGVTPPKAGQSPSYSAVVNDSRYSINTGYTGTNVVNGIYWWDKTTKERVDSSEGKFIAGHEYMFQVAIKANTGYEFATTSTGTTALKATVNINEAKVYGIQYKSAKEYVVVDYTFPVLEKQKISDVKVINVAEPKLDESPSYIASTVGTGYSVKKDYTNSTFK